MSVAAKDHPPSPRDADEVQPIVAADAGRKTYQAAYYAANREKKLERMRAYREANREKMRERRRVASWSGSEPITKLIVRSY